MKTIQQTIDDTLIKFKDVVEKKGGVKRITYDDMTIGSIYYNCNNVIQGIEFTNIFLIYHNKTILSDPKNYFFKQLIEHQAYDNLINDWLSDTYKGLDAALKLKESAIKEKEIFPEPAIKLMHMLDFIPSLIYDLFRGKGASRAIYRLEDELETSIVYHSVMQEAINDRKDYLEKDILPRIIKSDIDIYTDAIEMIKVQYNISNTHSRLVLEAGKQLNIVQEYVLK